MSKKNLQIKGMAFSSKSTQNIAGFLKTEEDAIFTSDDESMIDHNNW
jgi:hypothetical protein